MAKTYDELLAGAQKIKENDLPESNTHDLVGEQLVQMVNRTSEDKTALDKSLTNFQKQLDILSETASVNTKAIQAEQERAEAAEMTALQAIGGIGGRVTAIENGYATDEDLLAERERAKAAEKANADTIAAIEQAVTNNNSIIVSQGDVLTALVAETASLVLTLTPDVVLRNEPTDVTVKAVFGSTLYDFSGTDIKILKDGEVVSREDSIKESSYQESLTPAADVVFSAETVFSGKTLTASKTLSVVDPLYAGAGAAYADIVLDENKQTARKSAAGTYNVKVANDGDYVWLLVPRGFAAIKKATLSGFDFPLETPTVIFFGGSSALTGGIAYSCYRSSNQYAAGNLSIVIS